MLRVKIMVRVRVYTFRKRDLWETELWVIEIMKQNIYYLWYNNIIKKIVLCILYGHGYNFNAKSFYCFISVGTSRVVIRVAVIV